MNTPSTSITRLMRCIAKDCASCFYACRFPLDEEPDVICSAPLQISAPMTFNQRADEIRSRNKSHEIASAENITHESTRWPSFANEDYIVFCFKDDGGIDLVERKTPASDHAGRTNGGSKRRTNHKPLFCDYSEKMVDEDDDSISDNKGEEEGSEDLNIEFYSPDYDDDDEDDDDDDVKEITEVEEIKKWKAVPARSSESIRSNSSSSSFAFPVMNWEWKGSPERMPKLQKRPHKERAPESEERHKPRRTIQFQCCRF